MKKLVKQIVRKASTLPGVGRLVRILAAIYRLPEIREEVLALTSGHYARGPGPARPALWRALDEVRENTVGDANLTRSVPVTLRRLTREVHALRQQRQADAGEPVPAHLPPDEMPLPRLPQQATTAGLASLRLFMGDDQVAPAGFVDLGYDTDIDTLLQTGMLAPESADEVHVAYRFETFAQDDLRNRVLPHLYAAVKAGGSLRVRAVDAGAALAAYAGAACSYDELRRSLYGVPGRDGLPRLNMLTPDSLTGFLREAGFEVTHAAPADAHASRPYAFDTSAIKPGPDHPAL